MSNKVLPFRVITSTTPSPAPQAPASVLPEDLAPEQRELIESLSHFVNFMLDRKLQMKHFVCIVGLDEPIETAPGSFDSQSYIFSSAIQANDFALSVKLLDNALNQRINGGSN